MKRFLLVWICILFFAGQGYANHLKGGWIQYEYLGPAAAANTSQYRITVRQYLDCSSTAAQRDQFVYLGIFDLDNNQLVGGGAVVIPLSGSDFPNKTTYSPCINPKVPVCYFIDRYTTVVTLPNNTSGYELTVQRCCRIANIVNLGANSSAVGISYTNKIPGVINGVGYYNNTSPVFAQKDTAIVCYKSPFTFDFSATDADGDEIVYHFCDGLIGGNSGSNGAQPNPPSSPPYSPVQYISGYSGTSPMGSSVVIDSKTGIISGIAPAQTGDYVVAVCADEYRNNVMIGTTKKEIHIKVADCSVSGAALKPTYINCNNTVMSFQNESTSSNITSYLWDFGVTTLTTDTSTNPTPTYDYLKSGKDSGTFTVKLVVVGSGGCKDSTTAQVKIYPVFKPAFGIVGSCFLNPYKFFDSTASKYGALNSWRWDFGDNTSTADSARSKDSAWKYPSAMTANVKLVVTNTKGCIDSLTKIIVIPDKPFLDLAFKDTLICSSDTLMLKAGITSGTLVWTPATTGINQTRIINTTSTTPLVYPSDTTLYRVTLTDNGCINTDSVKVNVVQFISVDAGNDSTICKTDIIHLHPTSYAVTYLWTASSGENVLPEKQPAVQPAVKTKYFVTANLGHCQAKDSVTISIVPYPLVMAGSDTSICFGGRVMLTGSTNGSSFRWTPATSLSNAFTLRPLAAPSSTTAYVLYASDTLGCPKEATDTITVTVIPAIQANAGKDTLVLANTPIQLNATGGANYLWSPGSYLSAADIPDPIATLPSTIDSIVYTVTVANGSCFATDQVVLMVYKGGPDIIVPSAFTPNNDGKNDVARPVTVGVTRLNFFTIYNRWGQPVFSTSEFGKGWDGIYNGVPQKSDTYVYMAEGTDAGGNVIFRKGTIALIR